MKRAILGAVPLLGALGLHLVIALRIVPRFAKMYADFGTQLPLLDRIVVSPAWVMGWCAWLVLGGGAGLMRLAGGRRPGLLLAVLGSTSLVWIASIFAMYLPIFGLANAIKG